MRKAIRFLNPIAHLGDKRYSIGFPFVVTLLSVVVIEFCTYVIARNPNSVGLWAIFVFITLIVYFSSREGKGSTFYISLPLDK